MSNNTKIESTLYYNNSPFDGFQELGERLTSAFSRSGIQLRRRLSDYSDLVFSVGGVIISASQSVRQFGQGAASSFKQLKPSQTTLTDFHKWMGLQKPTIAISVTDKNGSAKLETRAAICYISTLQMVQLAEPSFVHWAKSGILYSIEEFRETTGVKHPVAPRLFDHATTAEFDVISKHDGAENLKGVPVEIADTQPKGESSEKTKPVTISKATRKENFASLTCNPLFLN